MPGATGTLVPAPPLIAGDAVVEARTGAFTLLLANFGKIQTNTGASATLALTLPKAADVAGMSVRLAILAAFIMRFTPVSGEAIFLNGSGVVSKYVQAAGVIGNYLEIYSDGVRFLVMQYAGVITKEA